MKKLLFTGLLGLGLFFPYTLSASHSTGISDKEFSGKKHGKNKTDQKNRSERTLIQDHPLQVKAAPITGTNYM